MTAISDYLFDFLAESTVISCVFLVPIASIEYLGVLRDFEVGHRTDLPLWLALPLAKRGVVNLDLPKQYGSKVRSELSAGAKHVNLRDFSFDFFSVGFSLASAINDEDLFDVLIKSATGDRLQFVIDTSLNALDEDSTNIVNSLTRWESLLYLQGRRDSDYLKSWVRHEKRKALDYDNELDKIARVS